MLKIYLHTEPLTNPSKEKIDKLKEELNSLGYQTSCGDENGYELNKYDIIICIVDEKRSKDVTELIYLTFVSKKTKKKILYIFMNKDIEISKDSNFDIAPTDIIQLDESESCIKTAHKIIDDKIKDYLFKSIEADIEFKKDLEYNQELLTKDQKPLKTYALVCFAVGLAFIITGLFIVLLYPVKDLDSLKTAHGVTEKNDSKLFNDSTENNITLNEEYKINWGNTLYFAIRSLFIMALVITAAKCSFYFAKMYSNESFKTADRKYILFSIQSYLHLLNKGIDTADLIEIVNNKTPVNEDSLDTRQLNKALELICKVKDVVNSEKK